MPVSRVTPTSREVTFGAEEIIVSKTDLKGVITYANDVFSRVSGYCPSELVGQPHNIIRHPDCPAGVFKLFWDTLKQGEEIFAFIKNITKDGSYFWVLAHVSPVQDRHGTVVGYHSSRRSPSKAALREVERLYERMRAEEKRHSRSTDAAAASLGVLEQALCEAGLTYDEFVWDLISRTAENGKVNAHARVA